VLGLFNITSTAGARPLLIVYLATFAGYGVASPFLPSLLADRGLGAVEIGLVLGVGSGCRLLAGPAGGSLADRTGAAPRVLSIGLAAAAVVTLGFSSAYGIFACVLVEVAYASLLAPLTPIADALALFVGRQGGGLGLYGWLRGAASGAFIAGSAVAGQAIGLRGVTIIVWFQSALLVVAAISAWRVPGPRPQCRAPQAAASVKTWELFRLPTFLPLMTVAALIGGSHAMHDGFEVIRWRSAGMSARGAGLLWAESVAAEILVFLLVGPWLIARIGVRRAAAISAASGVVRWGTAAITASSAALAIVEPLHGFTFALLHLVCMRVLGEIVPERLAASAQTLYGTVIVGGAVTLMTFVSGPLYARFGAGGFWVMAALCATAIPICATISLPGPKNTQGNPGPHAFD
jgi:MFS transporter, PPP family, 3-phenylpropionic acid transporter